MARLVTACTVLLYLAVSCVWGLRLAPVNTVLNAPFTPFSADGSALNLQVIPALARDANASGVNVVWIAGGLGEFETLTMAERKALAEAWVQAALPYDLFVLVHVGTTVQADAIELAQHAAAIGAHAIASVPPYYELPLTPAVLTAYLAPIAAAAPSLPFYYYHIPSLTKVSMRMVRVGFSGGAGCGGCSGSGSVGDQP